MLDDRSLALGFVPEEVLLLLLLLAPGTPSSAAAANDNDDGDDEDDEYGSLDLLRICSCSLWLRSASRAQRSHWWQSWSCSSMDMDMARAAAAAAAVVSLLAGRRCCCAQAWMRSGSQRVCT